MPSATAAALLRDARLRAALTQTELADFAGIAQSVVSAYESGRREPSVDMVRKLVAAAGFDLELVLTPARERSALRATLDDNRVQLRRALHALGAKNIRIFGSVARGDDGPESDIDLLIDTGPTVGLFALGRMRTEAERILGHNVDIVLAKGLKADLSQRVLAEAIAL